MNVKYERCCRIDVHKKNVVACVIVPGADGQPVKETRTFETLTSDLEGLANWLRECGVTQVVMESTGVYWKPVFNLFVQTRLFEASLQCWDSLPGINRRIAEILVAEVGADLKPFAHADQLASWAGMCTGNKQSGGKRFSGKTRKGSKWLRRALIEAAHGTAHTKAKYFQARYRRLAARRGKQRAAVAVGHSLLVMAFHLITKQLAYQDLGANYFDERDREAVKRRAVQRLEKLGFQVQLRSVSVPTI